MDLTPEQRKRALECWKNNVCETGHGTLTVAYADGFGENVWRQVTKMEFIAQALTYPSIKKIVYTSATGDVYQARKTRHARLHCAKGRRDRHLRRQRIGDCC